MNILVIFVDDLNGFVIKYDIASAIISSIIGNPMDSLFIFKIIKIHAASVPYPLLKRLFQLGVARLFAHDNRM